jgi:hypothetical protein
MRVLASLASVSGSGQRRAKWALGRGVRVVGIAGALLSCQPSGDLTCADGVPCADGQRCIINPDDQRGTCEQKCQSSASCADATPLCDSTEHTCRACFVGEDAACRGRDATHPRCGGGRCVQCLSPQPDSAQALECQSATAGALSTTPVCDSMASACRPCRLHRECDSGVCAKDGSGASYGIAQGSCVPIEQVLVVDANLCNRDGPVFCTVKQAFDRIDAQHRYVLLRRSADPTDFSDLQLGYLAAQQMYPLQIIGPLADGSPVAGSSQPMATLGGVSGKSALTITGCQVVIEGVPIRNSTAGVACTGDNAQVRVVRSYLSGNDTALSATSGCKLTVEQTWFGRGPDGSAFAGAPGNARSIDVMGSDFWVSSSVFADNGDSRQDGFGGVRVHSLSTGSRTRSTIINSTFMQQSGLIKLGKYYTSVLCDAPVSDRLVIMNTLLFTDMPLSVKPEEHYIDSTCGASLHHNASNDPTLTDDKSLVLAMAAAPFVAGSARNLHLGPNITVNGVSLYDGGVSVLELGSDRIVGPSTDLDGRARNTSGPVSLGAYEP